MDLTRRTFLQAGSALAAAGAPTRAFAANDKVQVGVIGTGARAQELITALMAQNGVEIVGVVDAYKGRVERAIDRTKGRAKPYRDYTDILADKSIDAVVVATPDHWHRKMVVDAVNAGKDVYCEKPLTYTTSEGLDIIRAAKETKRIVQVGSQGMSTPVQQRAKQMIKAGDIGQVTMIRAAFNRNTASGAWIYPIPPDASPQTVNWDMFLGSAPKRPFSLERFFRWRCYKDYSGGIATDLFVHLCTTINFLMDAKMPASVMAMGELYRWKESREVPDTMNAILEYPEGFVVNLSSTFNNQTSAEGSFQILGTKGTIMLADGLSLYPEMAVEDNKWIVESWPKALEEAYYKDPKVQQTELVNMRAPRVIPAASQYKEEGPGGDILHMSHFIESVRSRQPYWEDATAGHHAAACAHMVNKSVQEKRVVEWDFVKDDIKA